MRVRVLGTFLAVAAMLLGAVPPVGATRPGTPAPAVPVASMASVASVASVTSATPDTDAVATGLVVTLDPGGDAHAVATEIAGRLDAGDATADTATVAGTPTGGGEAPPHVDVAYDGATLTVTDADADDAAGLADVPGVASVAADAPATITATPDPGLQFQWALPRIRAEEAWATTRGAASTVIAVLDTGVAPHPDLTGLLTGWNVMTGTSDTADGNGHGTSVAVVAAARADNGFGTAGVCPQCSILPVKVFGDNGAGLMSDVAEGIRWAAENGADIINLSLSSTGDPAAMPYIDAAVDHARSRGVLVVAAAGNEGVTTARYPASYGPVLAVAGHANSGKRVRYAWSNHGSWVDVSAPGSNMVSRPDGGLESFDGTSSAAPVVAGIAGLVWTAEPTLREPQVRERITSTAGPGITYVSAGAADALAAVTGTPAAVVDVPEQATLARVSGSDRYVTAARTSKRLFDPGIARVYVATGANFPDGLSASAAASRYGGPVLLTRTASLPAATAAELERLDPREIVVTGGTSAVSEDVLDELAAFAPVRRVRGDDRYDTAAEVATDAFAAGGVVFLASGAGFPDALAGAPAAARAGAPVLLTAGGTLPAATARALEVLAPSQVVVLGGRSVVADAVLDEVAALTRLTPVRLSGANRFDTAAVISGTLFEDGASTVYLASGGTFPDALAGGAAAAAEGAPLLTTATTHVPDEIVEELARLGADRVVVLGGEKAVRSTTVDRALRATAQ